MICDELLNDPSILEDPIICGKILLHKTEWELSFICDFCHKNLSTLTELLLHAINQHVEDVSSKKLSELLNSDIDMEENKIKETLPSTLQNESENDENDFIDKVHKDKLEIDEKQFSSLGTFNAGEKSIGYIENKSIEDVEEDKSEINSNFTNKGNSVKNKENYSFLSLLTTFDSKEDFEERTDVDFILDPEKEYETMQKILEEHLERYRRQLIDDEDNYSESTTSIESENEQNNKRKANFEFLNVSQKPSTVKTTKQRIYKIKCGVCSKAFPNHRQLAVHRKIHGSRPFICKQCGVGFANKRTLITHIYRHKGIRPYECAICKKTFRAKPTLKIHMQIHTGERLYKCTECDRRFYSDGDVRIHMRRHKNIRRHLCPICGKTFYNSCNLNDHMATHSTERPHKCQECDACFALLKGLRQHMLVHSEVKKYDCKFCGKLFAQAAGVYSHVKVVHKHEKDSTANAISKKS